MKDILLNSTVGVKGEFTLTVRKNNIVTKQITFPNIITDYGINRLAYNSQSNWAHVGTGTTPPTVNDAQLEALVASTTATSADPLGSVIGVDVDPGWPFRRRINYEFPVGTFDGTKIITEVGISEGETENLFSRALLEDTDGNPTSLLVLSDEILTITYARYTYLVLTDSNTVLNVDGVPTTVTGRAVSLGNASCRGLQGNPIYVLGNPQPVDGFPSIDTSFVLSTQTLYDQTDNSPCSMTVFSEQRGNTGVRDAYIENSLIKTGSVFYEQTRGNLDGNGIGSIVFLHGIGMWQFAFNPKIPKDTNTRITFSTSLSWGRYTP